MRARRLDLRVAGSCCLFPREQDVSAGGTTVEEQIEERELWNEAELAVALRVRRVREPLPLDGDARAAKRVDIQIRRRAARAGERGAHADRATKRDDAIGLSARQ